VRGGRGGGGGGGQGGGGVWAVLGSLRGITKDSLRTDCRSKIGGISSESRRAGRQKSTRTGSGPRQKKLVVI